MAHIATIVSGKTKAGRRDDLFTLFRQQLAPRAAANAAQPLVVWLAAQGDAEAFHLVEIYTDPAAMEENSKAEWFRAYMSLAAPLLDGQPIMRLATPRWAKGVAIA